MNRQDLLSAGAHALIALIIQISSGLLFNWPLWAAALFPAGLFYGREIAQEGRKAADRLKISSKDLWKHPREAALILWPGNWGRGNQLDFYMPVAALLLSGLINLR